MADVPPGVTTSRPPCRRARRAGGRDLRAAELTATLVAAVVPKSTAVAPVKPVPVIVTDVPPAEGPAAGLTPVTAAAPCS